MKRLVTLLLFAGLSVPLPAQTPQPAAPAREAHPSGAYHVDVAIVEFDAARKVNTRSYALNVTDADRAAELKIGNRVPIVAQNKDGNPSITYMDVGLTIRCALHNGEDDNRPVSCSFDISNLVPHEENASSTPERPVLRSVRASSSTVISLGKPSVFTAIDDPSSTRRFQFEVTVTRAK